MQGTTASTRLRLRRESPDIIVERGVTVGNEDPDLDEHDHALSTVTRYAGHYHVQDTESAKTRCKHGASCNYGE
jgi:hypothetical protein